MGRAVPLRWTTQFDLGLGIPRRDRQSCDYEAYVPDNLVGRQFTFDGIVAADVADAERGITNLNQRATAIADTEALARLLLRAESVASSRIEGLEIGARRLLRADAVRQLGEVPNDVGAAEVLANIDAMSFAIQAAGEDAPISIGHLLEVHRRLLSPTRLGAHAGRIRTEQNWIGGSSYNPCSAAFVPPPPDLVEVLLEDLCAFCNDDSLPAVAQAALAHAQFETIHPFADGNGRVGRALIHMILRRRQLATRVLPPVSLVLATRAKDYIDGLTATRYVGEADSIVARNGINLWVGRFAAACQRAVEDADAYEERVKHIQAQWRERVGSIRSDSALEMLLQKLPGAPVITVQSAAKMTGRSIQAVNEAIARLVGAHILVQAKAGKRNVSYEASDLIDEFTDLERRLASPVGDTRIAAPTRTVPYRPNL